jgi:hypothetical protein
MKLGDLTCLFLGNLNQGYPIFIMVAGYALKIQVVFRFDDGNGLLICHGS